MYIWIEYLITNQINFLSSGSSRSASGQLYLTNWICGYKMADVLWLRGVLGCRSDDLTRLGIFPSQLETSLYCHILLWHPASCALVVREIVSAAVTSVTSVTSLSACTSLFNRHFSHNAHCSWPIVIWTCDFIIFFTDALQTNKRFFSPLILVNF